MVWFLLCFTLLNPEHLSVSNKKCASVISPQGYKVIPPHQEFIEYSWFPLIPLHFVQFLITSGQICSLCKLDQNQAKLNPWCIWPSQSTAQRKLSTFSAKKAQNTKLSTLQGSEHLKVAVLLDLWNGWLYIRDKEKCYIIKMPKQSFMATSSRREAFAFIF